MDFRKLKRDAKAVSPVIATIIIVAVAIVMAIAVAYWMLGLSATFTRYEKLEFTAAYADSTNGAFEITLKVKNTGTTSATITDIFINGRPLPSTATVDPQPPISLNPGGNKTITISNLSQYDSVKLSSGLTVEVMLQTASGNQYPKTIVLP